MGANVEEPVAIESTPPAEPKRSRWSRLFSITRTGVLLILAAHLLACVGVIVLMPGGWPVWSVETVSYRVLPVVLGVALLLAMIPRFDVTHALLAVLSAAWTTATLWVLYEFPVSRHEISMVAGVITMLVSLSANARTADRRRYRWEGLSLLLGILIAIGPLRLLHAPPISARPLGGAFVPVGAGDAERRTLRLDANFALDSTQATVTVSAGRRYAYIEPVLTFLQRSPDACWTIFSPRADRLPPRRSLQATNTDGEGIEATYTDGGDGLIVADDRIVLRHTGEGRATIDASTKLNSTQWSHLNTFTQLTVAGHHDLRMRFSPAPEVVIAVTHAGYPFGAPARFAYLDSAQRFHIVEASSAEKGPFRELGAGPINGSLTITLLDGDQPFLIVELQDWAAQCSTEPSPTAGYGVPQNAIEFGLLSDDPKSPATIFISLASTSVGRGWNTVGHGAGVYRNRMTLTIPATLPR